MSNHVVAGWFFLTLFCILIQGFYSMLEMAALSFNRVRLEYYANQGMKRAVWLRFLLQRPSRLFGTVMLGVNIALQVGSQSAREFYTALGWNPDIAIVTQTFFVVIIAELAPLFAARRYAEHVVSLGIAVVYGTYLLFAPLIFLMGQVSRFLSWCIGYKDLSVDFLVSRDELQKILETHQEGEGEKEALSLVISNIFNLRNQTAGGIFTPLEKAQLMDAHLTVGQLRKRLHKLDKPLSYIPLFHRRREQIVGMAFAKDLVVASEHEQVRAYAKSPWFITQETPLIEILEQFRRNNQTVAVVLNAKGDGVGLLSLDLLLEEIFRQPRLESQVALPIIERSFPGSMAITTFNQEYGAHVQLHGMETLSDLMTFHLEHPPAKGESLIIDGFEFTAEEVTLMGAKTISIRSLTAL